MTLQPMVKNLSGWPLFALLFAFVLPLSTALTNILSAGILIWGALHWRDCLATWREMKRQPVFIAMLAFLIVVLLGGLVALFNGINPSDTLGKHRKLLLFFILLALFRDERTRLMAFVGFGLGEFLSLATSLYAAWSGHLFLNANPGDYCTFRTHTYHNIFLALGAFGLSTWLLKQSSKRITTWLGWLLVALALYDILFLVRGKTGHMVLAALLILITLSLQKKLRLVAVFAVGFGMVAVALLDTSALHIGFTAILNSFDTYRNGDPHSTVGERIVFSLTTFNVIQQAPFLGHGTGGFAQAYAHYIQQHGSSLPAINNPHSEYLFFWAENGLAGIATIIGLYASMLFYSLRAPRMEGLGIAALSLAYAITSLANSFLLDHASGFVFITLLAALLASANTDKEKPPAQ